MAGLLDLSTLQIPGLNGGLLAPGAPISAAAPDASQAEGAPTSSILDSVFAPKAPHQATAADKLNMIGATLRDIGSGLRGGDGGAIQAAQNAIQAEGPNGAAPTAKGAKKAAPTDSALLYKTAQNLFPGDPKAQFLFATGNTDFLKSIGDQYGFHAVTGGDSVYGAPGSTGPTVAPKLVDNQGVYGTQTDAGYTGTGTAAPSYQQQADVQNALTASGKAVEEARHNHAAEGIDQQKVGIEGGQLGVAKSKLGIDQSELALHQQQFGHASNPTAPIVRAQADYDKLPSGQHLQYVAPDGSLRIKP